MSRFLRGPLVLASLAVLTALAACEVSSDPSHASPFESPDGGFEASAGESPDGGSPDAPHADVADAADGARAAELVKMQAHLDSLYLPSDVVHRFTTPLGDSVDCLPFVKQPGFALVNSFNASLPIDKQLPAATGAGSEAGLGTGIDAAGNTRGCPVDTVPIKHIGLADLARFDTLEQFLGKYSNRRWLAAGSAQHEHADFQVPTPNWGAQSTINLWKPAVEPTDFSLSQIWIAGGTKLATQTAEAGYSAYPLGFGDAEPRLFIYSTADGYNGSGGTECYNLECKAFIQLANSRVLIGGKFDKTSVPNGEQRVFRVRYQYCPASQCGDWAGWWLKYEGGTLNEWVGFYPASHYGATGALHDGADRVDFGGEVYYPRGASHTTTDMGSGQVPTEGFGIAAYQTDILQITPQNAWAEIDGLLASPDKPGCYRTGPLLPGTSGLAAFTRSQNYMFYLGGTGFSPSCP